MLNKVLFLVKLSCYNSYLDLKKHCFVSVHLNQAFASSDASSVGCRPEWAGPGRAFLRRPRPKMSWSARPGPGEIIEDKLKQKSSPVRLKVNKRLVWEIFRLLSSYSNNIIEYKSKSLNFFWLLKLWKDSIFKRSQSLSRNVLKSASWKSITLRF